MGGRVTPSAMDAVEISGHLSALKRNGTITDYATSNVNPDSTDGYRFHVYAAGKKYIFTRKEARAFALGAHYQKENTDHVR